MPDERVQALIALGSRLMASDYKFITVTPETHRRVVARLPPMARSLRDVFGWCRPFDSEVVPSDMLALLRAAGAVEEGAHGYRSRVRFSSFDQYVLVHSAFPTDDVDAVFFGPDTYRFGAAIQQVSFEGRVVDVGCGTGAGAFATSAPQIVLADISPHALALAEVNRVLAHRWDAEIVRSDVLAGVTGRIDGVVANPPYMRDPRGRVYRDGGGLRGEGLALRIVRESLDRLEPGGRLLLYTGTPIVAGVDVFLDAVTPLLRESGAVTDYDEIDPDVFGEELDQPAYADVERIAVVRLLATKPK